VESTGFLEIIDLVATGLFACANCGDGSAVYLNGTEFLRRIAANAMEV
jgi:hypothetical protein